VIEGVADLTTLHEGEFKILLPNKVTNPSTQPFILTIGPSLTMCVPIVLMVLLGSRIYGSHNSFMYMTLITGGTGCVMGVLWGVANHLYKKRTYESEVNRVAVEFEQYLNESKEYLSLCRDNNLSFLYDRYPSSHALLENMDMNRMFKRYRQDADYMFIRLGLGIIPFQMKVYVSEEHNEMFCSEERKRANALSDEFQNLNNAPVGIDLKTIKKIAIDLDKDSEETYEMIMSMIIQLSFLHDPGELKIALIYDGLNKLHKSLYEAVKWLPHMFSNGYAHRYACKDELSASILNSRLRDVTSNSEVSMVVFILEDRFIKDEAIYQALISDSLDERIAVLLLKDRGRCPNSFKEFISDMGIMLPDKEKSSEVFEFAKSLAGMKSVISNENEDIPDSVEFLNIFGDGDLNRKLITSMWGSNHPEERIRVPIGITYGGRLQYLDIHEKHHGPHGLIAGTTGAGKSELIQTYLLSLCMSFSPEDINFFLIDYKGGGTGCGVNRLPHCIGSISNLSGDQIHRAMKAITSENKRRQKMLSMANVNHVDAYQRLYRELRVDEPMPHLILIIDEFAELKKEAPEFMSEIISLAAVGRSLGIHLILATQKPAGVVDDKIWSNSNFKLCLRVQDKADSNDMLHRPEAAFLTNPGQCYIQIGNNEYFEKFQTGYCGGIYIPSGKREKDIALMEESGKRLRIPKDNKSNEDNDTVLKIVVDEINNVADEKGIRKSRSLWIDELEDVITLNDLRIENSELENIKLDSGFILGKYDDPSRQLQGVFFYEPDKHGNIALIGGSSTGKTSFINTLISQIDNDDSFYLIDMSSEDLTMFLAYGHCAGVLNIKERIDIFFYHLKHVFKLRKKKEQNGRLFIFIDNAQTFIKELKDNELDFLMKVAGEGAGCGIYIILTANAVSDVGIKLFNRIKTTISLELNDKYAYGDVMRRYHLDVYPKKDTKGRCLVNVDGEILEGQLAICEEFSDASCSDIYRWPSVSVNPVIEDFIREGNKAAENWGSENKLMLGYSLKSGLKRGIDISKGGAFVIVTNNSSDSDNLFDLIETTLGEEGFLKDDEILDSSFNKLKEQRVIILKDTVRIINRLYEDDVMYERCIYLEECAKGEHGPLIIMEFNPKKDSDIQLHRIFKNMTDYGQGICIGGMVNDQRVLQFSDLSYSECSLKFKSDKGYMKIHGKDKSILLQMPVREKKEDEDDYD